MVKGVKFKLAVALGAVTGGVILVVRRKRQQVAADAALWAEATDPVGRFGER